MVDQQRHEAEAALTRAAHAAEHVRQSTRWFPYYIGLIGLLGFGLIVAIETAFPSGWARLGAGLVWAIGILALSKWAETQDVHPVGANRRVLITGAIWFVGYMLLLGPIVRWQAGDSLLWWTYAAAMLSLPFWIEAVREWRRA